MISPTTLNMMTLLSSYNIIKTITQELFLYDLSMNFNGYLKNKADTILFACPLNILWLLREYLTYEKLSNYINVQILNTSEENMLLPSTYGSQPGLCFILFFKYYSLKCNNSIGNIIYNLLIVSKLIKTYIFLYSVLEPDLSPTLFLPTLSPRP